MCGERYTHSLFHTGVPGSSPRVRGTQSAQRSRVSWRRFIPACAGNARDQRRILHADAVHPRVCGEREGFLTEIIGSFGSSPRVRGTLRQTTYAGRLIRFIPACAGNAPQISLAPPTKAVHPRVCGERYQRIRCRTEFGGSSPRVRGTPSQCNTGIQRFRFIPACAGNAERLLLKPRAPAVHPRVCGERLAPTHKFKCLVGSSPRVRGTLVRVRLRPLHSAVHPRVCGERTWRACSLSTAHGSSPRVRGTRCNAVRCLCLLRFIPACAGNARAR